MAVRNWWDKAKAGASTDSRAARAEANQRFVRETLARRQPRYARMVERAAQAVVREMTQGRSTAHNDVVARTRLALATA